MMKPQSIELNYNSFLKIKDEILIYKVQNILICGAGPVGLITAIQISQNFPHKNIVIMDLIRRFQKVNQKWKNLQYPHQMTSDQMFSRRRGQVVSIRDDCRDLFPFFKNMLIQKFPNRVWGDSTNVPIRQLEDALMEYVQSSKFTNIKLKFDEHGSANIKQILNKQKFDLVIGCDGAGSRVREQLAPEPTNNNLHPDCKIEGKRYIFGTDYSLGASVDQSMKDYRKQNDQMPVDQKLYHYHALLTITQMRFLLNAYYPPVSNNDDAKGIQGFLNVRLSQEQYNSLAKAGHTVGVKCNFIDPALTTTAWRQNQRGLLNLQQNQRSILTSVFNYYGLNATKNCGFIYLFELRPGYSSEFGFTYQNKDKKQIPIFLCGDAAISHHFWSGRGLNTGIKSVSFLLDCLCYPKKQSINNYNSNMKRLAERQIVQRSAKYCQFNGKGQPIPTQMSLFDQRCGENQYISANQTGAINPSEILEWKNNIHKRILQLKEGSFRSNGTRGIPKWPDLSLSTNRQQTFKKIQNIENTFSEHMPRIFRNVIHSNRWYLQGKQPQVYSQNKNNHICYMLYLGYCYKKGYGVVKDYKKAVELFIKIAEQGYILAQINLGDCYYKGEGFQKDYKKAVQLYKKAMEQGYPISLYNMGVCYENGYGVQKDIKKALQLYQQAAQKGNQSAQYSLGLCYSKGVEKDYKTAVQYFEKAAQHDNINALAHLGYCYQKGFGTKKNYEKAIDLYKKAAENGNQHAQYNLGNCYYKGQGVEKDYQKAIQLFQKAAQQGNTSAQSKLIYLKKQI